MNSAMPIAIELLGQVCLRVDGVEVDIGPRRRRAVFGFLAARAGRAVSRAEIIDAVWGDEPPGSAAGNLHSYVSELRRLMEPPRVLVTVGSGYRLDTTDDQLDLRRFERQVDAGARLSRSGDADGALAAWESALGQWRGTPFADIEAPYVEAERTRLSNLRLAAVEGYAETLLTRGNGRQAVAVLEANVAEHPLHERLAELFIRALHATGRRSDALAHFSRTRKLLAEELGLDPSPPLRQAYERALADNQAAGLPARQPWFAGRAHELDRLSHRLGDRLRSSGDGQVLICTIDGPPGVGKTALAVEFAHRVRRHFPDGTHFLDLRDLPPLDALDRLLRAFGRDPGSIPAGLDERIGVYRSFLAGKRVLMILDDARQASQVRPLLPSSAGCLVVVTSRNRLTGLAARDGAVRLSLRPLAGDVRAVLTRTRGVSDRR